MLPDQFRDRLNELVHPRFEEYREQAQLEFNRIAGEMSLTGNLYSGARLQAHHEACVQQVEQRACIVWTALQRLGGAMHLTHSETLAQELKAELEYYVPMSLWELPDSYPDVGAPKAATEFQQDLLSKRERVLKKLTAEIKLHVDALQTSHPTLILPPTKEVEQKFRILLSHGQAETDFVDWRKELGEGGHPIAILFVDIDHFKELNTRFTETRVDDTVLPEAMHLLKSLVHYKGEAYRAGGDEFIFILPNHDTFEAAAFAERLRSTFEKHVFRVNGESVGRTLSIGVALWPDHGSDFQEVKQRANDAKQLAKLSRNTVKLADPTQDQQLPLPRSGLSEHAQRLAVLLNTRSEGGYEHDPTLEAKELVHALGVSEEEVALAADELEEKEWVSLSKTSGMGKAGFSAIWPTPILFFETDPALKGWNPQADARTLATTLVNAGRDHAYLSEIDIALAWGPRRLNPAASFLVLKGYVNHSQTMGSHPYAYTSFFATARTRRFATGTNLD